MEALRFLQFKHMMRCSSSHNFYAQIKRFAGTLVKLKETKPCNTCKKVQILKKTPFLYNNISNSGMRCFTRLHSLNHNIYSIGFNVDYLLQRQNYVTYTVTNETKKFDDGHENGDMVQEWIHPDERPDLEVSNDPQLKELLKEIASDFGKDGVSQVSVNKEGYHETTGEDDGTDETVSSIQGEMRFIRDTPESVFSLDEVVELLHDENAQDMCVIKVPPTRQYVDYFIVVSARSTRHLKAMTMAINQAYKRSKMDWQPFLAIEGKDSDDWMCIDFGNIVVHFMLPDTRELYELEKLWTLGPEYDEQLIRLKQHKEAMKLTLQANLDGIRDKNDEEKAP